MMAFQGPSQHDVACLASTIHREERPTRCTFSVPFDFLVLLGGLEPVKVLDGLQHGGAELGRLM